MGINMSDKNNKTRGFKEGLKVNMAAILAAGTVASAVIGTNMYERASADMSKYNVDNDKYEEYVKDPRKLEKIEELENSINIYEQYNGKDLTESESEELAKATKDIEDAMRTGVLVKVYRDDIFKEKIKSAYRVSKVDINWNPRGIMNKDTFDVVLNPESYSKRQVIDNEDKIKEVEIAVRDIVSLQSIPNKESYDKREISEFIQRFNNMKGFSNLTLIKEEGKPLTIRENNLEYDYKTNTITLPDEER